MSSWVWCTVKTEDTEPSGSGAEGGRARRGGEGLPLPETPLSRGVQQSTLSLFIFFLNLYLKTSFYWRIVTCTYLQGCVTFRCTESGSVIHIHISAHFFFQRLFLRNYRVLSRVSCATQLALTSHLFHLQKSVSVSPGFPLPLSSLIPGKRACSLRP